MNKKLIFLICLLLKHPVIHSMKADHDWPPTIEEVFATNHQLTVTLYGLYVRYQNNPSTPAVSTFEECLKKHMLLDSLWLAEKGFLKDLEKQHRAGKSREEARAAIENNTYYQNFGKLKMPVTQRMLMANLLQAFIDCSCYK